MYLLMRIILIFLCILSFVSYSDTVQDLRETSNAFRSIAKQALPAVVYLEVESEVEISSDFPFGSHPFSDPFFEQFFGPNFRQWNHQEPRKRSRQGQGSGFIISKDGYILTNSHVVNDATRIMVTLADERKLEAKLIGSDPKTDVALIRIENTEDLPIVELGNSDLLQVGDWVLAAGSPFGLSQTITAGIVSALNRNETKIENIDYGNFIQTDASINPGNSGGPLLNIEGKVVGINTAIMTRSGGNNGIGFAIPINQAISIKDQLISDGKVTRSILGVYIQNLDQILAEEFGLAEGKGILISKVIEDSAAAEAGLKAEDIIIELNGIPVGRVGAFRNKISSTPPDTEILLKVFRNNKYKEVKVITKAMDSDALSSVEKKTPESLQKIGLHVVSLESAEAQALSLDIEKGVLIIKVDQGSAAWNAGLRPGQVITNVDRKEVENLEEFFEALDNGIDKERILFLISEGNGSRFFVVRLD